LQFTGSFRHTGQIIAPQPTQVLSALLHAQWLHVLMFNFTYLILPYNIKFIISFLVDKSNARRNEKLIPYDRTYF
jgi:hypothetical protein